jgi:hypothetical protein
MELPLSLCCRTMNCCHAADAKGAPTLLPACLTGCRARRKSLLAVLRREQWLTLHPPGCSSTTLAT